MSLKEYYELACSSCREKQKYVYTPRCESNRAIYFSNKEYFDNCKTREEVQDLALQISFGDQAVANSLIRIYKSQNKSIDFRKNKNNYRTYLKNCKSVNGYFIVDRKMILNSCFRHFCKTNNIKISSSIRLVKKAFVKGTCATVILKPYLNNNIVGYLYKTTKNHTDKTKNIAQDHKITRNIQ